MEWKRPTLLYISVLALFSEKDGKTVLQYAALKVTSGPCHENAPYCTLVTDDDFHTLQAGTQTKATAEWPSSRQKFKEPSEMVRPLYSEGKKGGCQPLPTEDLWLRAAQMLMAKLAGSSEKWQIIVSEHMASHIYVWTRGSWKTHWTTDKTLFSWESIRVLMGFRRTAGKSALDSSMQWTAILLPLIISKNGKCAYVLFVFVYGECMNHAWYLHVHFCTCTHLCSSVVGWKVGL